MKPTPFDVIHATEMVHRGDWIDPVDYPDDINRGWPTWPTRPDLRKSRDCGAKTRAKAGRKR